MKFVFKNNQEIKKNFLKNLNDKFTDYDEEYTENIFEDDSKFLYVMKNIRGKYSGEELFYNLLQIGV